MAVAESVRGSRGFVPNSLKTRLKPHAHAKKIRSTAPVLRKTKVQAIYRLVRPDACKDDPS
jgi:hypothetical protein